MGGYIQCITQDYPWINSLLPLHLGGGRQRVEKDNSPGTPPRVQTLTASPVFSLSHVASLERVLSELEMFSYVDLFTAELAVAG